MAAARALFSSFQKREGEEKVGFPLRLRICMSEKIQERNRDEGNRERREVN